MYVCFTEGSFLFAHEEHHVCHNHGACRKTLIQQKAVCLVVLSDVFNSQAFMFSGFS